ncbi:MAG: helix-turn-helix domain-containing protein [Candidatus Cloacimonetes bacterium]|jgi:excisionase family DNA binding protein|nr:helix-turn-helix domain-containing protein [Candidatus Cloacimonadota bacterium]
MRTTPLKDDNAAPGFMTVQEVSRYLHVPVTTVRYWSRTGKLPSYKPFGRHIYFRKDEVNDAIRGIGKDGGLHDCQATE